MKKSRQIIIKFMFWKKIRQSQKIFLSPPKRGEGCLPPALPLEGLPVGFALLVALLVRRVAAAAKGRKVPLPGADR